MIREINKTKKIEKSRDCFIVNVLGVIFNPKNKKILIGRRENDPYVKKLTWCFPGGKLNHNQTAEQTLKQKIKQKTGMKVEDLGPVFSRIFPEEKNFLLIYHLCEVISGKEKPGKNIVELKWVNPEELQKYFTTSFDPRLKEYIMNLK